MKAVFSLTKGSGYDDLPYERCHFSENSNNRIIATEAVGDWIVYSRSGTGLSEAQGGRSYVACARVTKVDPALNHPEGGYYAWITVAHDVNSAKTMLSQKQGGFYERTILLH